MNRIDYLPEDIFALIMDTRRKEMKKDKQLKDSKNNYDKFVRDFKELIYCYKDDILTDKMGSENLYNIKPYNMINYPHNYYTDILDEYELYDFLSVRMLEDYN